MTKQVELWQGQFGDDYTDRNEITSEVLMYRRNWWLPMIMNMTSNNKGSMPVSYLEVGAGVGVNMLALSGIYKEASAELKLGATEPNKKARDILRSHGIVNQLTDETAMDLEGFASSSYDVVFTSGVLIHIHPDDLHKAMQEIYRVSSKHIICAEYFAAEPREVKYRDQEQALWLRDYGSYWMEKFPLMCTGYGFAWKKITKLDNITWWVFSKTN